MLQWIQKIEYRSTNSRFPINAINNLRDKHVYINFAINTQSKNQIGLHRIFRIKPLEGEYNQLRFILTFVAGKCWGIPGLLLGAYATTRFWWKSYKLHVFDIFLEKLSWNWMLLPQPNSRKLRLNAGGYKDFSFTSNVIPYQPKKSKFVALFRTLQIYSAVIGWHHFLFCFWII